MKQARIGWAAGAASALLVLSISSCATSTSTTTAGTATAPAGAKPAVKVSDEPMKPDEIAAAQAGGSAAAAAAPAAAAPAAAGAAPAGAAASAQAVLQPAKDSPGFSGRVIFYQAGSQVRVVADVAGVSPLGNHGFHVHENGKCERDPGKDFASAGGHFNPAGTPHACPDAASHHAGDLGNIVINADGTGHVDVTTSALSLSGASSVVGRAIILHAAPDDCTTQPTGNAGGRLACGVIAASGADGH
ncbi:MAG TPA: superoxide dismutase family protein [Thermoanaerobaculia bacterium]|nr:superoxide dismutase family protein [Thermoanaerobaculia bacterium]